MLTAVLSNVPKPKGIHESLPLTEVVVIVLPRDSEMAHDRRSLGVEYRDLVSFGQRAAALLPQRNEGTALVGVAVRDRIGIPIVSLAKEVPNGILSGCQLLFKPDDLGGEILETNSTAIKGQGDSDDEA